MPSVGQGSHPFAMISNCAASGADSRADPVTGIVTRKDKTTGQTEPAAVRPAGIPDAEQNRTAAPTASLSVQTLLALTTVS